MKLKKLSKNVKKKTKQNRKNIDFIIFMVLWDVKSGKTKPNQNRENSLDLLVLNKQNECYF